MRTHAWTWGAGNAFSKTQTANPIVTAVAMMLPRTIPMLEKILENKIQERKRYTGIVIESILIVFSFTRFMECTIANLDYIFMTKE